MESLSPLGPVVRLQPHESVSPASRIQEAGRLKCRELPLVSISAERDKLVSSEISSLFTPAGISAQAKGVRSSAVRQNGENRPPYSPPMPEKDAATDILLALAGEYTHLVGSPEENGPFALLSLAPTHSAKPDRREGVPYSVFQTLWRSGWIEVELQAGDLNKRLYRISPQGRAQLERLQAQGDGAGI